MGHSDEPKMDELKKLLRRLDGLDGTRSLAKTARDAETQPRGYVGALRGAVAPAAGDEHASARSASAKPNETESKAQRPKSPGSAIYVAAAIAAIVSTATVYLLMSWQTAPAGRSAGQIVPTERSAPKLGTEQAPGSSIATPPAATETVDGLVRQADNLLEKGDITAARALLARAAELGSGPAAFRLGQSYDPDSSPALSETTAETDPALAKAWYARASALGAGGASREPPNAPADR